MAKVSFRDWLRETLRKIATGQLRDDRATHERIKTYLALVNHGYTKEQALAIMDLYVEEEKEACSSKT